METKHSDYDLMWCSSFLRVLTPFLTLVSESSESGLLSGPGLSGFLLMVKLFFKSQWAQIGLNPPFHLLWSRLRLSLMFSDKDPPSLRPHQVWYKESPEAGRQLRSRSYLRTVLTEHFNSIVLLTTRFIRSVQVFSVEQHRFSSLSELIWGRTRLHWKEPRLSNEL